jgi:ubiquitin carboxyl-terminal hydrolase 10
LLIPILKGGQQGDAEEFLGFLLETLDEELVLLREEVTGRRHTLQAPFGPVEEKEEAAPLEEQGWHEVGKRNRTVVTRTVSRRSFMVFLGLCA